MSNLRLGNLTIHNTLGATLVGFASACCIYGILASQVFSYYMRYPSDRRIYKFLVVLITVVETADQACIAHLVYYYAIVNFANVAEILRARVTWSFIMTQMLGSVIGLIVKTSFALRVWRFSERNKYITGLIILLTYGQFGLAMTFTAESFQLSSVFDVVHLRVLGTIALGLGVLTDIVIASALCYFLNKLRTGYQQSDSLVNSLVRYAISTGLFTGAVSLTCLILYNIMPDNLIFIAVYFNLSKLYAISFLATLNTRRVVRGRGTDRQGSKSGTTGGGNNHTNLFHLGTRVPSIGNVEWEDTRWNPDYESGGSKMTASASRDSFPLNSYASPIPYPASPAGLSYPPTKQYHLPTGRDFV